MCSTRRTGTRSEEGILNEILGHMPFGVNNSQGSAPTSKSTQSFDTKLDLLGAQIRSMKLDVKILMRVWFI